MNFEILSLDSEFIQIFRAKLEPVTILSQVVYKKTASRDTLEAA
ncbi:hypothetical protein SAMN04487928_1227 [Butyrivibrio proteoclasticus]|uniref:Uncharacterized protein n=1 Tax=Butyrivibrio proteoclasticus TaxID=43305 RepID=A0A1I5WE77_9FIRM|nr:hypothetical protein SAMN04487928_1227 [Butyrivibrio proteoclasticus]